MDEGALHELAASISVHGLIQPILVRPDGNGRFEIIAGERRWRAAQLAGLDQVPVIQREVADEQALSIALIENIQREDLNPLEEAQAIQRLIDEFHFTHERCAEAIGRSRSATSNLLRLLNLAESVQALLLAGDLDMGHARALLAVEPAVQILLANRIVAERLTVRETEKLIANWQRDRETGQSPIRRRAVAPDQDLERFSQQYQMPWQPA
jgi:ParB family chromosome partitioning protein